MIRVIFHFLQVAEESDAYTTSLEVERFLGKYGIYVGVTLLLLIVLIIMYIKKHRQGNNGEE